MISRILSLSIGCGLLLSGSSLMAAEAGSIAGKATLSGAAPAEVTIKFDSDPKCKLHNTTPTTTRHYVCDSSGGLANVFVYVKKGFEGKSFPAPKEAVLLDQEKCLYQPYVLGVQTGQKLTIKNSDDTLHNVHALAKNNPEFNIGQPVKGMTNDKVFNKPEIFVKFKCDVHPWMFAFVGVVPHPYFAVTGADGSFTIPNLPDGTYTVAAVHPKAGEQEATVTVKGGAAKADFAFAPKAK